MMTMKEVLNHKPYFEEWTEDVERLYGNEKDVMEMLESIKINYDTLLGALKYLENEIENDWNRETATTLLDDISDFLMLDL